MEREGLVRSGCHSAEGIQLVASQYVLEVALRRDRVPSFDAYPFNLPAVRSLTTLKMHPRVTFLVGENGAGKSTLIEAIAVGLGFNPEGGSKSIQFSTAASHSELHQCLRVGKGYRSPKDGYFLRAESFYNVASEIDRLDAEPASGPPILSAYGGKSLHEQSHGEAFLSLLFERFGGKGLYILDEPESALSPRRQLAMLSRIHALCGQESQFIIATHSPLLMAYPHATIYALDGEGIRESSYEQTEHFKLYKAFLDQPHQTVAALLSEPPIDPRPSAPAPAPVDEPDDDDEDSRALRALASRGLALDEPCLIDFKVTFDGGAPPIPAQSALERHFEAADVRAAATGSGKYLVLQLYALPTHALLAKTREDIGRAMAEFGGVCETWSMLGEF